MAENDMDISDELQDWRFLAAVSQSNFTLPKRGEKDFEPDGTNNQKNILAQSREAMYSALQGPRRHTGKNHITCTWFPEVGMALVDTPRGPHFRTIGKADAQGRVWLTPEETVYLLERGSMECWWPQGAPMSLQAAYACCIQAAGDLENLLVYSYLKKIGFVVQRASTNNDFSEQTTKQPFSLNAYRALGLRTALRFMETLFVKPRKSTSPSCLLERFVYRDYESAFDDLQIVPCHDPLKMSGTSSETVSDPLLITYHVWKPTEGFRKSNPGPPHFRVVVLDAREQTMPTLAQLADLFDQMPIDTNVKSQAQIPRLKTGWKNVILAVVDAGVINFFRVSDVGFGQEQVYTGKLLRKRMTKERKVRQ